MFRHCDSRICSNVLNFFYGIHWNQRWWRFLWLIDQLLPRAMMKVLKLIITCYNLLAFLVPSILTDVPGPSKALVARKWQALLTGCRWAVSRWLAVLQGRSPRFNLSHIAFSSVVSFGDVSCNAATARALAAMMKRAVLSTPSNAMSIQRKTLET